jgi:hypothetical protein
MKVYNKQNTLVYIFGVGLFLHLFGTSVANYLHKYLLGVGYPLYLKNQFEVSALMELTIIYIAIFSLVWVFSNPKQFITIKNSQSGAFKWLIRLVITGFSLLVLIQSGFEWGGQNRALGQWDRGLKHYLERLKNLIYPLVAFYILRYNMDKSDMIILALIVVGISVSEILVGNRRDIAYIIFTVYLSWNKKYPLNRSKNVLYAAITGLASVGGLFVRGLFNGGSNIVESLYSSFALSASSIGNNSIHFKVKELVNSGGMIDGLTFKTYLWKLMIPSPILYAIGVKDTSINRANVLFNIDVMGSHAHGMGFMVVSDFYWNFGYVGYIMYVILMVALISFVHRLYNGTQSARTASMVIMVSMYGIFAQRSDFGAMINTILYTLLFLFIVSVLANTSLKR